MTVTTNTSAAKTFVAFFTREETKGPKVEVFKTLNDKPRAPVFDGKIGNKRVSFFLRSGPKGPFLSLVGEKLSDGTNNSENLGTAKVVTLGSGTPILAIDFIGSDGKKTPIFASISKKVTNDDLVAMGLDVAKQAEKQAAAASSKKAAAPAKKAVPPKKAY